MLHVENIYRAYDDIPVLRGVDLEVGRGEIVCLLGPSGCGKTTLLRIIAGLERADKGDVRIDGESIVGVPVHQRDFGLMFQDFALFPHMNVEDNVRFGLRMRGVSRDEQQTRVREALALVGLEGFEKRDVAQLSGGERQRVALARSLAPRPRLLMLDEPLGSLDAALRERLVVELREIIKRVGLTALYVTHDQSEAYAIADRMAVMNAGQFEQVGRPEWVYRRPETVFVARFLGLQNIAPVIRQEAGIAETPLGAFPVSVEANALLLHPDGLSLTTSDGAGVVRGVVGECTFTGDSYRLRLVHDSGLSLMFRLPVSQRAPSQGETVTVHIDPEWLVPLRVPMR